MNMLKPSLKTKATFVDVFIEVMGFLNIIIGVILFIASFLKSKKAIDWKIGIAGIILGLLFLGILRIIEILKIIANQEYFWEKQYDTAGDNKGKYANNEKIIDNGNYNILIKNNTGVYNKDNNEAKKSSFYVTGKMVTENTGVIKEANGKSRDAVKLRRITFKILITILIMSVIGAIIAICITGFREVSVVLIMVVLLVAIIVILFKMLWNQ